MSLATRYLGLTLRSPFIVGASPLCDDADTARRLQDAGAGAVVLRSLFAEQLTTPAPSRDEEGEDTPSFPAYADYQLSPAQYLRHVAHLKQHLSIPVIASLNGHRPGAWTEIAPRIEQAGADAIELNFYQVITDPAVAADQVETEMLATVREVVSAVRIPVAVKLSPFHSSVAQLVIALELEGSAGTVLFNRFYQPDVDPVLLEVRPQLHLSDPAELLLRLRWLAILSPQVRGSLAAGGGVHSSGDAAKALLTGAHAVQLVSVLLRHGPGVLTTLCRGLSGWMREHGFAKIEEFRGRLNLARCHDPAAFERANYIHTLQSRRPEA
ncbi:dihydroorotate dehydrogenase-like protein [Opitutus sp. GAS368]|uniref:dihydroorotate dehydrogenase-like protein n=1 Tax=Opitutus sp. GAS368 TaxID=1882749 RepID=UPI00087B27A4|nr:dihydroorotate dehydrogenase-like protein [Opitutus sp. GAS368]SDS44059.1 dihydroorotate dehydrogenase (fumarate) [Opitutus sp. GAS368]